MSPKDHQPRLDISMLAATFLESVLIGVFYCLLVSTVDAFLYRARTRSESIWKPMSVIAMVLCITISGHWILDLITAFEAFVRPHDIGFCFEPDSPTYAERKYLNLADWKQVANSAFYVTSTVVGDAFMIYRLHIVWGRDKLIVIPPVLLCLGLIGTGTVVTYLFSQAIQPIFKAAGPWITACFILTFLCNFYSTALIAVRIFLSSRHLGASSDNGLAKIRNILVEAAALYSVCVILSLVTYVGNSNIQFICVAVMSSPLNTSKRIHMLIRYAWDKNGPVIGIIFCMIVTRAHRSVPTESQTFSGQSSRITTGTHVLRPVTVRITTQVEADSGLGKDSEAAGTPQVSPRHLSYGAA